MTVFIDDMYLYPMGQFRGMRMSHMIADTEDELHAIASKIGMRRSWYQGDHYDVGLAKRELAVKLGAQEVTLKQLACMSAIRKRTGTLPAPADAVRLVQEDYGRRSSGFSTSAVRGET